MNFDFNKLPRPYIITLSYRTDRHKDILEETKKINLQNYNLFKVEKSPHGGEQGCFESHVKICKAALENGEKMAFILEDDFETTGDYLNNTKASEGLNEAVEFISTNTTWELMYFGVLPNWWTSNSKRIGKLVYKLQPWACTHAYIINESYMKEVSTWSYTGTAIDKMYRSCKNAFAIQPQVFKQRNSPSDIDHFVTPCPDFLRDIPVNFSGWYALNVGISGMNLLFVCIIFLAILNAKKST